MIKTTHFALGMVCAVLDRMNMLDLRDRLSRGHRSGSFINGFDYIADRISA